MIYHPRDPHFVRQYPPPYLVYAGEQLLQVRLDDCGVLGLTQDLKQVIVTCREEGSR